MSKLSGAEVGKEVCKILGLNPNNVAKVDILLRAGEAGRIEIIRYIDSTEKGRLLEILEKYEITKEKDANQAA